MADLGPQKWRRFPKQASGIFELKGIPGLPELDNLFLAEIGPIRLDYDNYFRDAIAGPTLLDWSFHGHKATIPSSEFPIVFEDPAITPAQLLAEYERRVGTKLEVDQTEHRITDESNTRLARLKNWWDKIRSRWFP